MLVSTAFAAAGLAMHPGADGPHPAAPEALSHMAPLIGEWRMQVWNLSGDGQWRESAPAQWSFDWALEGYAVQDLWIAPAYDVTLEDPARRTIGTNLRRVDPVSGSWEMAWLTNGPGQTLRFTAQSTPDQIVMESVAPHFTGAPTRITFSDMTQDSFAWRLERAADGETYLEVMRMEGARVE